MEASRAAGFALWWLLAALSMIDTTTSAADVKEKILPKKGNILFFHNAGTTSHLIVMSALAKGLAQDGHKVTTVMYKSMVKGNITNYNELIIKDRTKGIYKEFSKKLMEEKLTAMSPKYWQLAYNFWQDNQRMCIDSILERPEVVKMIEDKAKVDVIVTLGTCGSYLAHFLDAKIVKFSPAGPFAMHTASTGNALNPFVNPFPISPFIEPMTFTNRLINLFLETLLQAYSNFITGMELGHIREHFPNRLPDPYDVLDTERTVLAIANSHIATHGALPMYMNTIEVGGIHCQPGKELPPDLKKFMDSNPEGVVLVSFGSALSASQLTKDQLKVFQASFKALNIPIIWKWDSDDLSGMPSNVLIQTWLPQNDLLAHPNLRVFVTHGGLLSTQEALFHGVPLVGVPLGNDQEANIMRAERNGFAIRLNLQTLTEEELTTSIKRALKDQDMEKSVEDMHKVFTDYSLTGQSPMERGVSAFNYIIQDKGIEYLKPHKEVLAMPFYQIHGYDILIIVSVVLLIMLTLSWKCLKCCFGKCFGSKKSKQD